SKVPCDCAMRNHNCGGVGRSLSRKSSDEFDTEQNTGNKCPLNDILSSIDPKYYFLDTKTNNYLCLFCIENCMDDENENQQENNNNNNNQNTFDFAGLNPNSQ